MTNSSKNKTREEENRAKERVNKLIKDLARSISLINGSNQLFGFECEFNNWNNDVKYDIDEAIGKLGCALAVLVNWYDDDEKDDQDHVENDRDDQDDEEDDDEEDDDEDEEDDFFKYNKR